MGISNTATIKKALQSLLTKQGGRYYENLIEDDKITVCTADDMRFNYQGAALITIGHGEQSKAAALNKLIKMVKQGVHPK